jgi:hypothetical protein
VLKQAAILPDMNGRVYLKRRVILKIGFKNGGKKKQKFKVKGADQ